jgi:hypothetical protein
MSLRLIKTFSSCLRGNVRGVADERLSDPLAAGDRVGRYERIFRIGGLYKRRGKEYLFL